MEGSCAHAIIIVCQASNTIFQDYFFGTFHSPILDILKPDRPVTLFFWSWCSSCGCACFEDANEYGYTHFKGGFAEVRDIHNAGLEFGAFRGILGHFCAWGRGGTEFQWQGVAQFVIKPLRVDRISSFLFFFLQSSALQRGTVLAHGLRIMQSTEVSCESEHKGKGAGAFPIVEGDILVSVPPAFCLLAHLVAKHLKIIDLGLSPYVAHGCSICTVCRMPCSRQRQCAIL